MIQTKAQLFGTEAMDQIDADPTSRATHNPTRPWPTRRSRMTDTRSARDTREYYNADIRFIILVTVAVVSVLSSW